MHNKEEHAEVKKLVWKADTTTMSNTEYDSVLERAFVAFDAHAKEEETDQHPTLREKLSSEQNDVRLRLSMHARPRLLIVSSAIVDNCPRVS